LRKNAGSGSVKKKKSIRIHNPAYYTGPGAKTYFSKHTVGVPPIIWNLDLFKNLTDNLGLKKNFSQLLN
jgi:hypothetical protein